MDITQQCFALLPQVNFPSHNLNSHWRWRWWDRIQAIFLNLSYFNKSMIAKRVLHITDHICSLFYRIVSISFGNHEMVSSELVIWSREPLMIWFNKISKYYLISWVFHTISVIKNDHIDSFFIHRMVSIPFGNPALNSNWFIPNWHLLSFKWKHDQKIQMWIANLVMIL